MRHHRAAPAAPDRVLLVADWKVDPEAVVDAIRSRDASASLALLVPAKLNGLDWVGDPYASVPCAQRQLDQIVQLAHRVGLTFATAGVGDPEPLAAIGDALADWPADRLVLCGRRGRLPYPLDLRARAARATKLPVERLDAPAAARPTGLRGWPAVRTGHCSVEQPQPT